MVSGTAPTVIVTRSAIIVVVVDFLLNSGLYNLRRNLNVIVCFVNLQQEGIVGMIGIVISVTAKGGSINDQIITCLFKFEAIGVTTLKDGCRVSIRVDIVAYTTRKSDAVIIGITPLADNRSSFLRSETSFKLIADGKIFRQLRQKLVRMSDAAAPPNVGNRIVITNNTIEDLESVVTVVCAEVLLSLPIVVCKRRDRHGAHHGNCQQCGQQLFDYFLHHDLRKSPFKFF